MITFNEIKNFYSHVSDDDLRKIYMKRQQDNLKLNDLIAKNLLFDFPSETLFLPQDISYSEKVCYLLSTFLNSKDTSIINATLEVLQKYNYNLKSELLKTMQRADSFFSSEINFITFSKFIYGSLIVKNIEGAANNKVSLSSSEGKIELYPLDRYFNFEGLQPDERRCYCHNLTSDILCSSKDLYGAYYYIPLEFAGFIEHSVLIDLKHNLVLDLANNIVVPIDIWNKFYQNPSVFIKGEDFSYFSKRAEEELGVYLTTCTLDALVRKKG